MAAPRKSRKSNYIYFIMLLNIFSCVLPKTPFFPSYFLNNKPWRHLNFHTRYMSALIQKAEVINSIKECEYWIIYKNRRQKK